MDYNGRLLQLKSNLEILRQRLVSPLVRSNDSSTLSVEEQIIGLDDTYQSFPALPLVPPSISTQILRGSHAHVAALS